jgi:LAS superfamily LD-carboxypeptidase LdcB
MRKTKNIKKNSFAFILIFCLVIVLFMFCSKAEVVFAQASPTQSPAHIPSSTEIVNDYTVSGVNIKQFGCERAIISITFEHPKEMNTEIGEINLVLFDRNEGRIESAANFVDGKLYGTFDTLKPNRTYSLGITINDETISFDSTRSFTTPRRKTMSHELNRKFSEILDGVYVDDKTRLLVETQACLDLLGMEIGEYGENNSLLQSNLIRLEYSFNSLDTFIDYKNIVGEPNIYTLEILKDILSTDDTIAGEDFVREFVPSPHVLSQYAKKVFDKNSGRTGGKIETNDYVMYSIFQNAEILSLYNDIPFIKTSIKFKQKYRSYSNYRKRVVSAGNKARFSEQAADFMKEVGGPQERIVSIAGSEEEITINTLIAYSYMLNDAYKETGRTFNVNSAYRTYEEQSELYYERLGEKGDKSHLYLQSKVAVPGFSNHQFGLAIDFIGEEGILAFKKEEPELFEFLKQNASKYGFYNYLPEAWHWAYLGTIF